MICPYCKEEIADGAIKCKHCGSMLAQEPVSFQDNTELEDGRTQKIKRIYDANDYKVMYGIPIFDSLKKQLSSFWWWAIPACPLNCFVYILAGVWKKGLIVGAINWGIIGAIKFGMIPSGNLGLACIFVVLGLGIYVGAVMDYDIYRARVKNEDFWW